MKIVADFRVLMQLAGALGRAKKTGDQELIKQAQAEHDAYHDICMRADELRTGETYGSLYSMGSK